MGICFSSTLYEFGNFVTVQSRKPQPKKGVNVSKFEFQIHPFSTSYIHEKLDPEYNPYLVAEESFLISEDGSMKVFEK
jgi:hypothetical protein